MECAAGTDEIKVTPKGCKPVSEDRCASGFMAPAENVTFPKDPLETCCKCKEGETCPYCLGEECEDWEKKKYVTDKDCFEEEKKTTIEVEEEEDEEEEEENIVTEFDMITYAVFLLIVGILFFMYSRTPNTSPMKFQLQMFTGFTFIVGLIALVVKKYFDISKHEEK